MPIPYKPGNPNSLFLDDPIWWLTGILLICIGLTVSIFLHELGHWIMARLCGYHPLAFSVGEGRVIWQKQSTTAYWRIHLLPTSGYIIAVKTSGKEHRWQSFLLSFGGPLFTLLAAVLAWMGWLASKTTSGSEFITILGHSCAVLCVLEVLSLGYNVWPRHSTMGDQIVANDGMGMLTSLTDRNFPRPDYSTAVLQGALGEEVTVSISSAARDLHLEILRAQIAERHEDARQLWRSLLSLAESSDTEKEGWLAHISQNELTHWNDKGSLAFALECATALTDRQPGKVSYKSWLGALQIENGELFEGRLILQALLKDAPPAESQAFLLSYLGLADLRQHNFHAAVEKYQQAKRLHPWSYAVARLGAAMDGRRVLSAQ
jgi:hypothetical protein